MLGIVCAVSTWAGNFGNRFSHILGITLRKERVNLAQGIIIISYIDKVGIRSFINQSSISSIGSHDFSHVTYMDVS